MKKIIIALFSIVMIFSLTSCSQRLQQPTNLNSLVTKSQETSVSTTEATTKSNGIDLDLTTLSSTVVFSEVYNMLNNPDNFKGKVIKMEGKLNHYYDKKKKRHRYAVMIADATACCQQGLEFKRDKDTKLEIKANTEVTVIGTFNYQNDGRFVYCYLENSKILN